MSPAQLIAEFMANRFMPKDVNPDAPRTYVRSDEFPGLYKPGETWKEFMVEQYTEDAMMLVEYLKTQGLEIKP